MKKVYFYFSTLISFVLFSVINIVNATPLPAQFFVNSFTADVGDKVEFTLKVSPTNDKPVYTVVSHLEYDKNKLTFVGSEYSSGWVSITPEELTDPVNGVIKRAAGYPAGLRSLNTFVKYTFRAKAEGKTAVNIIGGSAYDAKSNDYGLQNKSITVTIGEQTESKDKKEDASVSNLKKSSQLIELNFNGLMAAVSDQDYTFTLGHKLKVKEDTNGVTKVTILNNQEQEVYKTESPFNLIDDTDISFTIPMNTLSAGNYTLLADSKYDNQAGTTTLKSNFGVLSSIEKIVIEEKIIQKIPVWYWALLAFFIACFLYTFAYLKSKALRKFIKNF